MRPWLLIDQGQHSTGWLENTTIRQPEVFPRLGQPVDAGRYPVRRLRPLPAFPLFENEKRCSTLSSAPAGDDFSSSLTSQEDNMKVSEVMTREILVANPEQTVQQAARMMADIDAGVLPVGEN